MTGTPPICQENLQKNQKVNKVGEQARYIQVTPSEKNQEHTMIFNSVLYENSMPEGMGVLEIVDSDANKHRLFIPLTRTELSGTITGPLASFTLTQVFSYPSSSFNHPIEAVYRFPLPGDAHITGAEVSFGKEILKTSLKEREDAKDEYHQAFEKGRRGVLLTRETPDIFTLHLTGIEPDQPVKVTIQFLQYGAADNTDISFRIPLTLAPRYIRDDERFLGQRNADPLLMLIDPGHTFRLSLTVFGMKVSCQTHTIFIQEEGDITRITLEEKEVRPDRDFVLSCHLPHEKKSPILTCQVEEYPDEGAAYLLATITPPELSPGEEINRELIILVDHSGSMDGPKWKAADWTVKKLLKTLRPDDTFALGVFHNEPVWFSPKMSQGEEKQISAAIRFLEKNTDSGGTELGKALEEGLSFPKSDRPSTRDLIIITDAGVTDEGRLIRMVREEQEMAHPRRISIICIDASPNSLLVQELVRVGRGIARFLTSDPEEEDITTALDKTLAFWKTPVMQDLFLRVHPSEVSLPDGAMEQGVLSLSSLTATPVSRVFQIPLSQDLPEISLTNREGEELAVIRAEKRDHSGIREWYGSARLRMLEQVRGGYYSDKEVKKILTGLGYSKKRGKKSLYPERKAYENLYLDEVLVQESLKYGIPTSLTAFVCTGEQRSSVVKATVLVPSAFPSGWKIHPCNPICSSPINWNDDEPALMAPPDLLLSDECSSLECMESEIMSFERVKKNLSTMIRPGSGRGRKPVPSEKTIEASLECLQDGIIFDGLLAGWTKITGIMLDSSILKPDSQDVMIEIYVNAATTPIASISLVDLLDGDIRPLNIKLKKKDRIRISLRDAYHHLEDGRIQITLFS